MKKNNIAYKIHIDGEDFIITTEMAEAMEPEMLHEYLKILWAQEHRERREHRCRDAKGVRCNGVCSQCQYSCSGKPASLEQMEEEVGFTPADEFSVEAIIEQKMMIEALYAALDMLDELDRQIIDLLFYRELTERKVAELVGMSQKGVNRRKQKILGWLKDKLAQ